MNSNTTPRSTASPFLNDYKLKFVGRRLLQTFLGGLLLKLDSENEAPWFIYVLQLVLFLKPFLFGGLFILATDLSGFSRLYISIIAGAVYFVYVFIFKLVVLIISNKKHLKNEKKQQEKQALKTPRQNGTRANKKTGLFNDEQLYEFDSCCSFSTLNFLIPPLEYLIQLNNNGSLKINKFKLVHNLIRIFFDSLIAGFMMFCSVYLESIVYLQNYYSIGGSICIFIFNWIVLCIGFYSLCIREPIEPAFYQPYDQYNVQHYHRSFYIVCFQLIEIIYNFAPSNAQISWLGIFYLKIVMISLPFLWFFGILPPMDSFFLWLFEQVYIYLYGGSATSTNLRLILQLAFSCIISLAHFIPSDLAIVIIFAASGYILGSIDIIYLFECFYLWIKSKKFNKSVKIIPFDPDNVTASDNMKEITKPTKNVLFSWTGWLYHIIMLVIVIIISAVIFGVFNSINLDKNTSFNIETILLYIGMAIFVLSKITADLQGVYIFFGIIRNPFYPKNCLSENAKKNQLSINQNKIFFKIIKYLRFILIKFIAPFLLCSVISIDCYINKIYGNSSQGYWRTLVVIRAFRWIWQSSFLCLFEMCFLTHFTFFTLSYNLTNDSDRKSNLIQYFLTGCLVSSFLRDRLVQFFQKCFTFILINITSWTVKKQRRKSSIVFLVLNFLLFFPFLFVLILIASSLSAPLLPLFTFPLYFIGFPRTKSFWPQKNNFFSLSTTHPESNLLQDQSKNSESDSTFYAQLVPQLLPSLRELIRTGSIGSSVQPDTYYLTRFQDRIIWIQIMESAHSFCIINIKGLELQETSCHTTEAQYIDDTFELAFENPFGANSNESAKKVKLMRFNPNPFNCMQPRDVLIFEAYSDAKNSLVGVLESSDSLSTLASFYPKILHYFIIKHLVKIQEKKEIKNEDLTNNVLIFNRDETRKISELPPLISPRIKTPPLETVTDTMRKKSKDFNDSVELNSAFESERKNKTKSVISKKNVTLMENKAFKMDDGDKEDDELDDWSDNGSISSFKNKKPLPKATNSKESKFNDEEKFNDPFDFNINEILGTFDEVEVKKSKKLENKKSDEFNVSNFDPLNNPYKPKKHNATNDKKTNEDFEKKIKSNNNDLSNLNRAEKNNSPLSLPNQWTTFLNENLNMPSSNDNKNLKSSMMSKKWLESILSLNESKSQDKNKKLINKEDTLNDYEINLWAGHYKFLLKCCHTLGLNENNMSYSYNQQSIQKFFKGDLPWSPLNEKLTQEHPDLYKIMVEAFRFTVKMVIDHVTICPISDDEEFFDNLKTYEQEWFIGSENEPEYAQSILKNKPFIFTLYKDSVKKSLNSRTLSIQQIKSPLAQLNSETVKSIWSSTNLELLYMTNDDDERYSIQAHPYILRNLTIQTSALGYCIYNSENIYLSLI